MTGSNSLRGWVSGESVISDLKGIREKCEDNGITPIFMTLPPVNPANIKRASMNHGGRLEGGNGQGEPVDPEPALVHRPGNQFDENQDLPTRYALDGLHLNFGASGLWPEP